MLTLEDQTVERLGRLQSSEWAPQGPCAALAWALALYLIEAYHPATGLDCAPAGRPAPGQADWHGVRIGRPGDAAIAPASGLIRFWDAAIADQRPDGNGWLDLGSRFLQGQIEARAALVELRGHLGLPDRAELPEPAGPPRWIFFLTLLRAAVDLIVDGRPISLTRGLDWAGAAIGDRGDPHPLIQARVLGVGKAGVREWLGLIGHGSALFVHRRDGRLIAWHDGWRIYRAAAWLPDASWRLGQYLDERLEAGN